MSAGDQTQAWVRSTRSKAAPGGDAHTAQAHLNNMFRKLHVFIWNCINVCVTEWADVAVWRHEDGAARENKEAGGGQAKSRSQRRYRDVSREKATDDSVMLLMPSFLIPEWSDEMRSKKCKKKNLLGRSERKKKVALVSGNSLPMLVHFSSAHNHLSTPFREAVVFSQHVCCLIHV